MFHIRDWFNRYSCIFRCFNNCSILSFCGFSILISHIKTKKEQSISSTSHLTGVTAEHQKQWGYMVSEFASN